MDLQRDAEMEALVFGQAASIDQLLNMLRGLDPQKDNLADNDELQVSHMESHEAKNLNLIPRNYIDKEWACGPK